MRKLIENVEHGIPFDLAGTVAYAEGKIASCTLAKQPGVNMTLMAFDAGERVSTHAAPGDAMAYILDGEAEITIDGKAGIAKKGQALIMPSGIPHAVKAVTAFKMLLIVVKEAQQ
ncbi:cupin domain-containing protein [Desulfosarcina sp. OttesenSCG-928-A07]|nr:cupin domain-containing protein [Desulfosarcina sp. OttesenSCG-928-G17]MDL2329342.1 cupin domain-containing protein [Desulfosarcina sp. OttesenSCG-928-A07]